MNTNTGITPPASRESSGGETARRPVAAAEGRPTDSASGTATVVGWAAVGFSALYLISDLLELGQGGFSTLQLVMTYVAEAAIPLFVLGLYAVQRPRIGRPGLVSAVVYAYTFVYFTSTVVYALVERTADWQSLEQRLGVWLTVHTVLMLLAGVGFGIAVIRAGVFPLWTGATLIAGMILMVITSGMPAATQTASAGIRDLAFAAMGATLLTRRHRPNGVIDPPH
jgi:hypothetical protein